MNIFSHTSSWKEKILKKIFLKFFSILISLTLIFPLFVPWKNGSFSEEGKDEHFLAVLLVNNDIYNHSEIAEKIFRYAQDIQKSTENTKALILPVPQDTSSEEIFRLLEKLYFEGEKREGKIFFLHSLVLIGDIPLPHLSTDAGIIPSIFPYTDFEDPTFIWNTTDKIWIQNEKINIPKAEIFHGIIAGTSAEISAFFDKNHETREKILSGKFNELVNDEIFFADFEKEQRSSMPPLLGQYETRQKISEELVNYRYNKNLLSAISGNFADQEVFSSGLSDDEEKLFNNKTSIYDNLEGLKADFKESAKDVPDLQVKRSLEKFIPKYSQVVSGFERFAEKKIAGTGRWGINSTHTHSEIISQVDTFVAEEIKKMNDKAFEKLKGNIAPLDSLVRIVDKYEYLVPDDMGSFIITNAENFRHGNSFKNIKNAKECSLYRGSYVYEDQYDSSKFDGDEKNLFLPDPLKNVTSQEVEFNKVYDITPYVLEGSTKKNINDLCDKLGQCCIKNYNKAEIKCKTDDAIEPIFSWNGGGKNIKNAGEVTRSSDLYKKDEDETSAKECQNFSFHSANGDKKAIYGDIYHLYESYIGEKRGYKNKVRFDVPSLIEHREPSLGEPHSEESLLKISSNILAKHIPSNRVHYIDVLNGDDGMKERVKHSPENFFRYKAKLNGNSARTKYELSRVIFEERMKVFGGNGVYNRATQPSQYKGVAHNAVSLKFHRIVKFKGDKMEVGNAYPIGKTGQDYENAVISYLRNIDALGKEVHKILEDLKHEKDSSYIQNYENYGKLKIKQGLTIKVVNGYLDSILGSICNLLDKIEILRKRGGPYNKYEQYLISLHGLLLDLKNQIKKIRYDLSAKKIYDFSCKQKKSAGLIKEECQINKPTPPAPIRKECERPMIYDILLNKETKFYYLIPQLITEASDNHQFTWDARAIANAYKVLENSNFSEPADFYLHDFASDELKKGHSSFVSKNASLDYFLHSYPSSNKSWVFTPISKTSIPDWMTNEQKKKLLEELEKNPDEELFYEVFEVLGVGDDVFSSGIPVGGRSFSGMRENAPKQSSFFAEITGFNIDNPSAKTKVYENEGELTTISEIKTNPDGSLCDSSIDNCSSSTTTKYHTFSLSPTEPYDCSNESLKEVIIQYAPIFAKDFYKRNVVEKTECMESHYFQIYTPDSSHFSIQEKMKNDDMYSQLNQETKYLDFLFQWKDMTSDEKHKMAMSLYLNANDTRLFSKNSERAKGYAYAHLNVQGYNNISWKGVHHNIDGLNSKVSHSSYLENTSSNGENESSDDGTENDESDKKDKCGVSFKNGSIPLKDWLEAVSCWMNEVKNIDVKSLQCGVTHRDYTPPTPENFKEVPLSEKGIQKIEITANGENFPAERPKTVRLKFLNSQGETALGERIYFSIFVEGGKITDDLEDKNKDKDGVQQSAVLGKFDFRVIPDESSSELKIRIKSTEEGKILDTEKIFSIIKNGKLEFFEKEEKREKKGDTTIYTFVVNVFVNGEKIPDFEGNIYLGIQDETQGYLSKKKVKAGEEFTLALRTDGNFEITATSDGIEKGRKIIGGDTQLAEKISSIQIKEYTPTVNTSSQKIFELEFLNLFGDPIPYQKISGSWEIEMLEKEGSITAEIVSSLSQKKYFLQLTAGRKVGKFSGKIFWTSNGVEFGNVTTEFSGNVSSITTPKEIEKFSLNALYATLIGLENYGNIEDGYAHHLANTLLHNSPKTNVITTQLISPFLKTPVAIVYDKGGIEIKDKKYEPRIKSLSPLILSFMDNKGMASFADFVFSASGNIDDIEIENYSEKNAIEIKKFEDHISFVFDGKSIMSVSKNGSFLLHSNAFFIKKDDVFVKDKNSFFLMKDDIAFAKITFENGKWDPLTQSSAICKSLAGDGFFVSDPKNNEKIEILPELQNAFSKNSFGTGFEKREKFVLEFASGNSVGESTMSSAEIFLVNFGDPFFKIPPPKNERDNLNFDETVGEEIFSRDEGDIIKTFPVDIDGDGVSDIASVLSSGDVIFLTRYKKNFKNWGTGIKIDPNFKMIQAYDGNNDGFEGIAYTNAKGELFFWENTKGVFTLNRVGVPENILDFDENKDATLFATHFTDIFPDIKIMSGKIFDADNDGFSDFGVVTKEGEVKIYYGNSSGKFSEENSKTITHFNFELPSDLSDALLIHFDGIEKKIQNPEKFLFPLSYFSTQRESKQYLEKEEGGEKGERSVEYVENNNQELDTFLARSDVNKEDYFLPTEKYFAQIKRLGSDLFTISKTGEIIGGGNPTAGKRVKFTIIIKSHFSEKVEFTLGDAYSQMLTLDKGTVKCINHSCGEKFVGASYPNIAQAIVFENLSLEPEKSLVITYEAEISNLPDLDFSFVDLNDDNIADITITQKNSQNAVERYVSNSKRAYSKFTPLVEETSLPNEISDFFDSEKMKDEDGNGVPDFMEEEYPKWRETPECKKARESDACEIANNPPLPPAPARTNSEQSKFDKKCEEEYEKLPECVARKKRIKDENNNGIPDFSEEMIAEYLHDKDGDKIPDSFDEMDNSGSSSKEEIMKKIEGILDETIQSLASCGGGGCLSLPINYAFLIPGQMNLGRIDDLKVGVESGPQPVVMPIFSLWESGWCIGYSCKQITPSGIVDIPFSAGFAKSTTRFYLAPTITGGLGIAVCKGIGGLTSNPKGTCFIQAISPKFLGKYCKDVISKKINALKSSLGKRNTVFKIEGGTTGGNKKSGITFDLSNIDTSIPSAKNTRLKGGPNIFADWSNRQIEEIKAMFTTIPTLTVYYPDLFGTVSNVNLYDTNEANSALQDFEKNIIGGEKIVTSNTARKDRDDLWKELKGKIEDGYDFLNPAKDFLRQSENTAESIDDLYRILESVPLIRVERQPIVIYIPSLTRRELIRKIYQLDMWVKDAEEEMQRFKDNIYSWPPELQAEAEKTINEVKKVLEQVKKLRKSLDFFLNQFPEMLGDFDRQMADYIYQIICYIDAITNVIDGWWVRNEPRIEKWEVFFATVPAIFEAFSTLPKLFNSYQSSCTTCHAGNYDSGTFELHIIGEIFPEIPVVRFPRLPDISLDISQINSAITVQLPDIEFRERPIVIPNVLPPLRLPDVAPINLDGLKIPLPNIPDLPTVELPKLPELPAIPLPELPNIPPPPQLPNFMKDFGAISGIIEKGLYLYCLIVRKSLFIHPEKSAMSVVETLTARPLNPLSIDFIALKLPEISLPSVSEIDVQVQTNLEKDFSIFIEKIKKWADEMNQRTYNYLKINRYIDKNWSNILDFSNKEKINTELENIQHSIDSVQDDIDTGVNNWNENIQNFESDLQEGFDNAINSEEIQNQLDHIENEISKNFDSSKNIKLWKALVTRNKRILEKRWENNSDGSEKLVDIMEVRKSLGLPEWRTYPKRKFLGKKYVRMRKNLVSLQEKSLKRRRKILATKDISSMLDTFPQKYFSPKKDVQRPTLYAQKIIFPQLSATVNSSQVVSTLMQNNEENGTGEIASPTGIFLSGKNKNSPIYKMLAYEEENNIIQDFFFLKSGNVDKQDIVYSTPYGIFLKREQTSTEKIHQKYEIKNPYTGPFEVGNFKDFLPKFQSPKNIAFSGEGRKISLTVFPELKENVSGIVYIKDISVFSEQRKYGENLPKSSAFAGEKRQYIFRLEKEVFDEVMQNNPQISPDTFFDTPSNFSIKGTQLHLRENSEIMISRFDSLNTEIFVEKGKTYTIRSRWVLKDGSLGNLSDHILVSNIPSDDKSAPIVMDNFEKTAYLYKENTISLSHILDLQDSPVSVKWDTDKNGSYEHSGSSIETGIFIEPFVEKIPIQISDESGNSVDSNVIIHYKAPSVFLDEKISPQKVGGFISPRYSNVPISLLRERYGIIKKIITSSVSVENSQLYITDDDGRFSVENIDLSPNVLIKDSSGKIIGEVLAKSGKLLSRDKNYSVDVIEGTDSMRLRQVLLNTEKTIVANVEIHTLSENSVQNRIFFPSGEISTRISGTYLRDVDTYDDIVSGPLPFSAPENAGGRTLFNKKTKNPLAHIYRDGNISFFPNSHLKIKLSDSHTDENQNIIFDILHKNKKVFEVMLVTNEEKLGKHNANEEKIEINRNKNQGGKLSFLSEKFFQKPILSALDTSVKIRLPFSDVDKNSQYYRDLSELFSRNLISGYEDGTFRPEQKITRAEFVQITLGVTDCLDCLSPSESEKKLFYDVNSFPDVTPEDWFDFCISKAKKLKMVQGYGDGFFRPNAFISRAEAVSILIRQAGLPLQNFSEKPMIDVNPDAWYYKSMLTALQLGLIQEHYGYTFPDEKITRGEFVKMASVLFSIRDCHFIDSDGDGIPDYIELYNGLNPHDPTDANSVDKNDLIDPRKNMIKNIPNREMEKYPNFLNLSPEERKKLLEKIIKEKDNTIDSDGDGIPDYIEIGKNPAHPMDSDNDGIPDYLDPISNSNTTYTSTISNSNTTYTSTISNSNTTYPYNQTIPSEIFIPPDSENDLCPAVPEDYDDLNDEDGCPEISDNPSVIEGGERIVVIAGDISICAFIDYRAQIRKGDIIWVAILKDDNSEIFSQSEKRKIQ